jgi:hypothetical protein
MAENTIEISTLDGSPIETLGPRAEELPQEIIGRLDSLVPVSFGFSGSGIRSKLATLRPYVIDAADLLNGEPSRAFDNTLHAMTRGAGAIVHVAYYDDGDLLESDGILVLVTNRVGPGGPGAQRVELVFYPFTPGSTLRGRTGTVMQRVPTIEDDEVDYE